VSASLREALTSLRMTKGKQAGVASLAATFISIGEPNAPAGGGLEDKRMWAGPAGMPADTRVRALRAVRERTGREPKALRGPFGFAQGRLPALLSAGAAF
jgi:hypothetical protein